MIKFSQCATLQRIFKFRPATRTYPSRILEAYFRVSWMTDIIGAAAALYVALVSEAASGGRCDSHQYH